MKIFFAPHADDEVLFGCFTILREQPEVVICMDTQPQPTRWMESCDAALVLGHVDRLRCWPVDNRNSLSYLEGEIASRMFMQYDAKFAVERVWAPYPREEGAHQQHNMVGRAAESVFGDRCTFYLTYRDGNPYPRTVGAPVPIQPEWVPLKLRALACFTSQLNEDGIHHFLNDQREYVTRV